MAILFDDASSEYLNRTSAVVAAMPLSMAAWFYTNDAAAGQAVMSISRATGNVDGWSMILSGAASDQVNATSSSNGTSTSATTSSSWTADTWHHACCVFTSATSRASYLDGGGKGTGSTSNTPVGPNRTSIGQRFSAGAAATFMSGLVAEVGIWNIALDDADAAMLADGFSPLCVHPESLVAYWPLIGRNDPSRDLVGGAGLTWTNTPTVAAHPRIIYPRRQIFVPDYTAVTPPASSPRLLGLLGVGI